MSDRRSTAEAGSVAPAPGDDDIHLTEMDMGRGDIGFLIEWRHLDEGYIMANDTDSFVSLDCQM